MEYDKSESNRDHADDGGASSVAAEPDARGAGGRFRKGQSGNPAGRRAWRKESGAPGHRLIGAREPTRALILAEAYRMVRVKEDGSFEDDGEEEMPANQAVIRAMTRAALSGNRVAQHRWTQIVREAEREQHAAQVAIFNALERVDRRRDPEASYEDDIIVDKIAGTVLVRGDDGDG
ncbi:MAG: DUF5681 domain-containing protein [Sphingomonas bacterium]